MKYTESENTESIDSLVDEYTESHNSLVDEYTESLGRIDHEYTMDVPMISALSNPMKYDPFPYFTMAWSMATRTPLAKYSRSDVWYKDTGLHLQGTRLIIRNLSIVDMEFVLHIFTCFPKSVFRIHLCTQEDMATYNAVLQLVHVTKTLVHSNSQGTMIDVVYAGIQQ